MARKKKIDEIVNSVNSVSKVFLILESIKNSKFKYLEILNPETKEQIMVIKLNLDDEGMVDFLDTFFDNGFIIRQISSLEFDLIKSDDVLTFKI
jgi:hypothetical protein